MKIVEKDNAGSDYYVETVICDNIKNEFYAHQIEFFLNAKFMTNEEYYKVEPDDYVLRNEPFEP
ncbi:MAG: hypothetical protein ACYDEJ_03350 [Desulfitobacteriaceae bacterium]